MGVSNGYRDISRISVACYEATQAVKEYFVRGRQQLISYQEVNRSLPRPGDFLPMLDNLKAETPAQRMQTASQFVQLIQLFQIFQQDLILHLQCIFEMLIIKMRQNMDLGLDMFTPLIIRIMTNNLCQTNF